MWWNLISRSEMGRVAKRGVWGLILEKKRFFQCFFVGHEKWKCALYTRYSNHAFPPCVHPAITNAFEHTLISACGTMYMVTIPVLEKVIGKKRGSCNRQLVWIWIALMLHCLHPNTFCCCWYCCTHCVVCEKPNITLESHIFRIGPPGGSISRNHVIPGGKGVWKEAWEL